MVIVVCILIVYELKLKLYNIPLVKILSNKHVFLILDLKITSLLWYAPLRQKNTYPLSSLEFKQRKLILIKR